MFAEDGVKAGYSGMTAAVNPISRVSPDSEINAANGLLD